jgi:hypothetical protein
MITKERPPSLRGRNPPEFKMVRSNVNGQAVDRIVCEGVVVDPPKRRWRCHRRIIADYLIAAGESVVHIFSLDHDELARITHGAVSQSDGTVTYPAAVEAHNDEKPR